MQFTTSKGRQDAGIDIATFRIERLGGPTEADHAYRSDLYRLIGAIAVAARSKAGKYSSCWACRRLIARTRQGRWRRPGIPAVGGVLCDRPDLDKCVGQPTGILSR